jgi:hypothetical protein
MTAKHGSLSYPCDKFSHWQDNLRAIALSMEALRKVDRYGVTRGGEQYRGFAALPPAQPIDHLAVIARVIGTTVDTVRLDVGSAIREALKRSHPDHGGSEEKLKEVLAAREALR